MTEIQISREQYDLFKQMEQERREEQRVPIIANTVAYGPMTVINIVPAEVSDEKQPA